MSKAQRTFTIAFVASFVPQLVVWAVYFLSFSNSSGETPLQKNVLWFYWPVILPIEQLQYATGWRTWATFGLQIVFGPLIGALVYSAIVAGALCLVLRRNLRDRSAA
jgi:hypothetical protein